MHLLPVNLAKIADVCGENTKFAMGGVKLTVAGDNTYCAQATDSKTAAIVRGPCVGPADEYPDLPVFGDVPTGESEALVPADVWKRTFTKAAKLTRKRRHNKPILESVAVKIGKTEATFAMTDLLSFPVEMTRQVEGRFPPLQDVIPKAQPKVRFAVDARMLARLLTVAGEFAGDGPVVFSIVSPERPITVTCGAGGQSFTGLVMPMAMPAGSAAAVPEEPKRVARKAQAMKKAA